MARTRKKDSPFRFPSEIHEQIYIENFDENDKSNEMDF